MPISSIGPSGFPPAGLTTSADKAAPATSPAPAEKAAAPAASAPDKDDAKAPAEAKEASSAPNMFKINPDGTVGPMHIKRHPNAPGVVHA